ncbi:MAG TPA: asparaginase, partial [Ilumatobacter sp.]|nr:asparaginase [Ilumatobacter sp.]
MPGRFPAGAFEPVAITSRSGFDESVHFGAAVVVDDTGRIVWSVGDANVEVYPRSACKPMQADAMLRCGLSLDPEQLALACASHDGTPRHVDVVRSTLAAAGLDESALGNTPDLPLDAAAAEAILRQGGSSQPITMNCSGKHAAMVAACVVNGWAIDKYLAPDHPLQVAITDRIAELAGPVSHVGVDGCGAPAHVVALAGVARAYAELARTGGEVWSAMTRHPELVGGERRDVTRLMRAVPGLMAKGGAEGMYAAALPGGPAAAVKISDGAHRASGVVLAAALREA